LAASSGSSGSPGAARPPSPLPTRLQFLAPRHQVGNVLHLLATHAALIAWLWLSWRALPLVAYVPLGIVACLIHQRAMSEWIHEGAHFNLLRGRRWNDALTNVLACAWFGIGVDDYRATHFPHHAKDRFFVPEDGDTAFLDVGSRHELRRAVLQDLLGRTVLDQYHRFRADGLRRRGAWFVVTMMLQLGTLALLFRLGRLDAWVLYYGTLACLYPLLNRLRVYGQHVTIDADGRSRFPESAASRTIDAGFVDRVLFTSPLLLYHHEHHRWPHLPHRALAGLCVPSADVNVFSSSRWRVLRMVYRGLPERAGAAPPAA
jgi:fatty acid desaturase